MCALRRKGSVLDRRIRGLEKEIASLNGDIKTLSKVASVVSVPQAAVSPVETAQKEVVQREVQREYNVPAYQQEVRMPASVLKPPSLEYTQPRPMAEQVSKKVNTEREQITRDGRFATYLMSRDFHDVRPLRHERYIQRNKAMFMIVVMIIIILYIIIRFMP